jgi:predicted  nucleic acid-binding Zn-ribbon protein
MKESLFKLLNLQRIDTELDKLNRVQADYPEAIAELRKKLETAKQAVDDKKQQAIDLDKTRRHLEGELETIQADLKKHQDRLYEVKTNREYDALQIEIEVLGNRADENETIILEGIEQHDDLKTMLEEEESAYKALKADYLGQIQDLQSRLDLVDGEASGWRKQRSVAEELVERPALSNYNRIRRVVRDGVAVVPIGKGSCGGCFRQLPPQRRMEVRRQDRIIRCENCGRILVWREEA